MELRELGAKVEVMGRLPEVESRAQRPKVQPGDQLTKAELETEKPKADPSS